MGLHKPLQISIGPIFPSVAFICALPECLIVPRILPWFPREFLDLGVERRQHGRVLRLVFQSTQDGVDVAGKACEDVDGALLPDHIGENDRIMVPRRGRGRSIVVGEREKRDVHDGPLELSSRGVGSRERAEVGKEEQT